MVLRNQRRVVQVNRKLRVCGDVGKKLPRRGRGPKCNISFTHYNELPARFFHPVLLAVAEIVEKSFQRFGICWCWRRYLCIIHVHHGLLA
jgi:hypothetical protein